MTTLTARALRRPVAVAATLAGSLALALPAQRAGAATAVRPLTAAALQQAVVAAGGTATVVTAPPAGFSALRLTVKSPTTPPDFPTSLTATPKATTTSTMSVTGWVAWSSTTPIDSLDVYGHGLGVPVNLLAEVAGVASAADSALLGDPNAMNAKDPYGAVVVGMDYRNSNAYAPDVDAEDAATAAKVLQTALAKALPATGIAKLARTVAVGLSEGGAVMGLMIEHHPTLAQGWIDDAGSDDVVATKVQLDSDVADGSDNPAQALALQQVVDAALGGTTTPAPCSTRAAALSPTCHPSLLAGLSQLTLVHATGDMVVPFAVATELRDQAVAAKVPTWFAEIDPNPGQPAMSMGWHMSGAGSNATLGVVNYDAHGYLTPPGLTSLAISADLN